MTEEATAPAGEPERPTTGTPPPLRETTTGGRETIPPSSETPAPSSAPRVHELEPPFAPSPATGSSGGAGLELEVGAPGVSGAPPSLKPRTFSKALVLSTVAVPRELLERAAVVHTLDAGGRRSLAAEFRALL